MTAIYVAVGPRREGMWRQPPVVDTDVEVVAERAAHEFELPARATKFKNWKRANEFTSRKHQAWVFKSTNVPYSDQHQGKHYIYKMEV